MNYVKDNSLFQVSFNNTIDSQIFHLLYKIYFIFHSSDINHYNPSIEKSIWVDKRFSYYYVCLSFNKNDISLVIQQTIFCNCKWTLLRYHIFIKTSFIHNHNLIHQKWKTCCRRAVIQSNHLYRTDHFIYNQLSFNKISKRNKLINL